MKEGLRRGKDNAEEGALRHSNATVFRNRATQDAQAFRENPFGSRMVMRHYSQILPRDFDLSPNFEIIKFNLLDAGHFDYKSIWADTPGA